MADAWHSYDSAAEIHDRIAVPKIFSEPASDLIARLDLPAAGSILDVGAGTGIAALLAHKSLGPEAMVVALDPSVPMLRLGRGHGLDRVVAGAVPGLPFSAGRFDRILASFVLSHLPSYDAAMLDMVRVLRPGGKLGATTWGALENEFRQTWQELAESVVDKNSLRIELERALPWEDWFTDAANLERAFEKAGLTRIEVHRTQYLNRLSIAEFLSLRESSLQGRFVRHALDAASWERFKETVRAKFRERFNDPIEHMRDAYIAIGSRA